MSVAILLVLQIPFDSPTVVPLTLQNSLAKHSDVPLQKEPESRFEVKN